jgi:fatty acid desaturase
MQVDYPTPVFGRKDLIAPDASVKPSPYRSTDPAHLESELYTELRAGVNAYFKSKGMDGRDAPSRGGMLVKSGVLLALTVSFYYLVVFRGLWMLTPFLGILFAMNGLAIQHDASHGAFSANRYVNIAAGFFDDLIGGSGLMWRHQHVLAHHAYPNDMDWDPDTFNNYPFLRLNPALPKRWWHQFQHLYILVLYSLIGFDYSVNDIVHYFKGRYVHITLHKLRLLDHILFISGKLAHFAIVLFIPLALHPWKWAVFAMYVPLELFGGFFLAALFAVSHNTDQCEYNLPKDASAVAPGTRVPCWAEMQIRTSCNWSCHSRLWLWASGGLNFQIEHHLFPGVAHKHYPAIHPIVRAACQKRNIPYNAYPTFTEIFVAHLAKIKKLGQGEGLEKKKE